MTRLLVVSQIGKCVIKRKIVFEQTRLKLQLSSDSQARRWIMKRHFQGMPTHEDFELVSEQLPRLKENEILLKGEYWSVDPYQRAYPLAFGFKMPMTMLGSQVGEVVESRNASYPVGSRVVAYTGWRELAVMDPAAHQDTQGRQGMAMALPKVEMATQLPEGVSRSNLLGTIGMPGNSAYFGLLDLCQPKEGETVVVSGAAGAVGNIVGQIAKIKGCKVIGLAGSQEKCDWLTGELGFHAAINYKKGSVRGALLRAAPKGVDCYFDNVGGQISHNVVTCMKLYGRVAVCGAIAGYNDDPRQPVMVPSIQPVMVANQIRMEGFVVWRWLHQGRWTEGLDQLAHWVASGDIKQRETVVDGFEKLPDAFIGMLRGDNLGKMVVRAKD